MCGICGFNWSDELFIERMKAQLPKLLPGCLLTLEGNGRARLTRYWALEAKPIEPSEEALADILESACGDHTMSDVPLGAFLSGGIDSSTVVSFQTLLNLALWERQFLRGGRAAAVNDPVLPAAPTLRAEPPAPLQAASE
jgi:hypothetical protein